MDLSKANEQREARALEERKKRLQEEEQIPAKPLNWPDDYYAETDAKERRRLLERAIKEELSPEEDAVRMKLWEKRYGKREGVDEFLASWLNLQFFANTLKNDRGLRWHKKEVRQIEDMLSRDIEEAYGEVGARLIYLELYHLADQYITICRRDKRYASLLFGMGSMNEGRLKKKIALDLYNVCFCIPSSLRDRKDFDRLRQAAGDCYCAHFPEFSNKYRQMVETGGDFPD